MATNQGPFALTLNTLLRVPDPTAQWGNPATRVQLSNASAFIVTVSIAGELFTLQSFTAQTLDTSRDGAGLTVLPTTGPAGAQGNLTVSWLLGDEPPPQPDGQLTAAAQYAVGLPFSLFNVVQNATGASAFTFTIPALPPNVRTLVFEVSPGVGAPALNNLSVAAGGPFPFYNQPPYLFNGATGIYTVVAPITAPTVGAVGITLTFASAPLVPFSVVVYGDTVLYTEDSFYNGTLTTSSAQVGSAGTTTLLTGPARIFSITAAVNATAGAAALVRINGVGSIRADGSANAGATGSKSFPGKGQILRAGQIIDLVTGGTGTLFGSVDYAYP